MTNQTSDAAFRITNTVEGVLGLNGARYVHDAARPFAVLFNKGLGEMCCGRFSTEGAAKAAVVKFSASRANYAARNGKAA